MRFVLTETGGTPHVPERIISYEITSEISAPCDGLRLSFIMPLSLGEISGVKAYDGDRLIFNGFADMQKITLDKNGFVHFIYARSSASLLVDNEAIPREYACPSANALCLCNASEFGFTTDLPDIYSENAYLVSKGRSCFAAINDFVRAVFGSDIYVDPNNVIRVYDGKGTLRNLDDYSVSSASLIINRSEPISEIAYKISSADEYVYHFKSVLADERGIRRKRLLNLSSIPEWQRQEAARTSIEKSFSEYKCVEIMIVGECDLSLNDRVRVNLEGIGAVGEFAVFELARIKNKNGEKTVITLKENGKGEVLNYVA